MSLSDAWILEYLILHISGGSTRNKGLCPLRIGRAISFAAGALGVTLLIRIAESLGWIPTRAGSFSKACSRFNGVGIRLGRYSSSVAFFWGLSAGLKEAVGWKYTAGL
jgi:hypothetical protein